MFPREVLAFARSVSGNERHSRKDPQTKLNAVGARATSVLACFLWSTLVQAQVDPQCSLPRGPKMTRWAPDARAKVRMEEGDSVN
jgi:hypothetical protein